MGPIALALPALLIRMSTGPNRSTVSATTHDGSLVSDVCGKRDRLAPRRLNGLKSCSDGRFGAGNQRHGSTLCCERLGDRQPNPAASTRDDRDLALQ